MERAGKRRGRDRRRSEQRVRAAFLPGECECAAVFLKYWRPRCAGCYRRCRPYDWLSGTRRWQNMVIGGTSAVAPLWAGLIALNNQQNGKSAGFIQPQIYPRRRVCAFNDIVSGNNGAFSAGPGWDACTGLGSPIGAKLIALLGNSSAATKKGGGKKPVRMRPAKKKVVRRGKAR